ncbi:MAG TPA: DNA polymerase III subunit chi [Rhodocyclaceae bacterium]|nr:DNA polymerase III subunit chi [Rhodocyclaceae bacterium]
MTKIFFYHGARDRLQAAAAWLAQAYARRQAVLVYAPDAAVADRLDRLLWTTPATAFLPHCRADAPLAGETPLLIAASLDTLPQEERLLNLSDEVPPGFSRFSEVVEIVSDNGEDRLPARTRFKFYRDRGYDLESEKFAQEPR